MKTRTQRSHIHTLRASLEDLAAVGERARAFNYYSHSHSFSFTRAYAYIRVYIYKVFMRECVCACVCVRVLCAKIQYNTITRTQKSFAYPKTCHDETFPMFLRRLYNTILYTYARKPSLAVRNTPIFPAVLASRSARVFSSISIQLLRTRYTSIIPINLYEQVYIHIYICTRATHFTIKVQRKYINIQLRMGIRCVPRRLGRSQPRCPPKSLLIFFFFRLYFAPKSLQIFSASKTFKIKSNKIYPKIKNTKIISDMV